MLLAVNIPAPPRTCFKASEIESHVTGCYTFMICSFVWAYWACEHAHHIHPPLYLYEFGPVYVCVSSPVCVCLLMCMCLLRAYVVAQ